MYRGVKIPDGFDPELQDLSVKEDEMCLTCKKNPLSGTLPISVVLKILGIMFFWGLACGALGMYYAETYGLCAAVP